jgi:hypothetical protein
MEEGIEAGAYNGHLHNQSTTTTDTLLLHFPIIYDLCEQYIVLHKLAQQTYSRSENKLIEKLANTIQSHIQTIYSNISLCSTVYADNFNLFTDSIVNIADIHLSITTQHTLLWDTLKSPGSSKFRQSGLNILTNLENIINILLPSNKTTYEDSTTNLIKVKTAKPSYITQIINPLESSQIIDPFRCSLQSNYYHPLMQTMILDDMDDEQPSLEHPPHQVLPKTSNIEVKEVETSIDTISDVLFEMEGDEPPAQTQFETAAEVSKQQAIQVQASFHKHRFSIYRKSYTAAAQTNPNNQILLFKSFSKCIKKIDSQAQILPIRNDRKIHSLTTTDQINAITGDGLPNFFKPYKRNKKTLSGDFHIGTSLSFDELKTHPDLTNWFHLYGYNISLSGCQTSDMVRIGFLARVRDFTYRDDLSKFISNTPEWKKDPFSFRLYFDTLSSNSKGVMTYVMMIDIDRPNIDTGMKIFQELFNGDQQSSPNKIPYLFFPLYKKTYTDNERQSIIADNDHHTNQVTVIALKGLHDLDNVVQLQQGMYITIRHLLIAVPTPGTSTGKLFLQVERQANSDWYLCCFKTSDAAKVTVRLGALEILLKKYVKEEDLHKLFTEASHTLSLNGQAAPTKKGRNSYKILEVPPETTTYTMHAMKKLYTPTPKNLEPEYADNIPDTTWNQTNTNTYHSVTPSNPPEPIYQTIKQPDNHLITIESNITNQNHRLDRLENCCSHLAETTQALANQISLMNDNVNKKFLDMTATIHQLSNSPNHGRSTKLQKHNSQMETVH